MPRFFFLPSATTLPWLPLAAGPYGPAAFLFVLGDVLAIAAGSCRWSALVAVAVVHGWCCWCMQLGTVVLHPTVVQHSIGVAVVVGRRQLCALHAGEVVEVARTAHGTSQWWCWPQVVGAGASRSMWRRSAAAAAIAEINQGTLCARCPISVTGGDAYGAPERVYLAAGCSYRHAPPTTPTLRARTTCTTSVATGRQHTSGGWTFQARLRAMYRVEAIFHERLQRHWVNAERHALLSPLEHARDCWCAASRVDRPSETVRLTEEKLVGGAKKYV